MDANANDVQFLRDVNCGLQYLPTFQVLEKSQNILFTSSKLFSYLYVFRQVSRLEADLQRQIFRIMFTKYIVLSTYFLRILSKGVL